MTDLVEGVAERRRRGQNEQEKKGEMSRDGYLGAGIKWCVGRPEKRERTERERCCSLSDFQSAAIILSLQL